MDFFIGDETFSIVSCSARGTSPSNLCIMTLCFTVEKFSLICTKDHWRLHILRTKKELLSDSHKHCAVFKKFQLKYEIWDPEICSSNQTKFSKGSDVGRDFDIHKPNVKHQVRHASKKLLLNYIS